MPGFVDKGKDKSIDLQNFGLRPDLYSKRNPKVSARLAEVTVNMQRKVKALTADT